MSSLEIAELCGKDHKNILRDIDNMLKSLGLSFEPVDFIDKNGDARRAYNLRSAHYSLLQ
jgi:phage regulator Rha-like protein